ncbi:MAG: ribbon-helix-helix protein, CopG family [Acidobacteriaceae bacterium]
MPASRHIKVLSVRLPEPEVRRLKSLAASRGVSVQEAVQQALAAWTSDIQGIPPEPLDTLQGSLADVDIETLMRRERQAELVKDRSWS